MQRLLTLALLVTLLAGCAEEAAQIQEAGTAVDEELVATEDTGVIRGVIVDPAIVPIQGVTVTLQNGETATTVEDGSFGFSDLEPGTYFLTAEKIGYDPIQSSTEVVAGVALPPILRVQMSQNVSALPYVSFSQFSGNLRCGLATPAVGFGCSVVRGTEDTVGEHNGEEKHFEVIPDWLQVELVWKSTQSLGDSLVLSIRHCCDNDRIPGDMGTVSGPSPQIAHVTKEGLLEHEEGAVITDGVELSVFPSGNEAIRDAAGENLGVILDQNFQFYTTEFYNFIPIEGWAFIEQGNHPIPA